MSVGILDDVRDCLKQVIQDTRTLTFDLSYPILYELGFEVAVAEWLNGQIRDKYNIETEFQDDGKVKPLDDDIRAILFRNVRELLFNVVKHVKATKVKVSVGKVDEHICVIVEDDGVGFEPSEVVSHSGFGIFSIRERLEQLDGHFEVESEPGRGSRFTMMAPLKLGKYSEGVEV
jgi:signal transduction histidine kinase